MKQVFCSRWYWEGDRAASQHDVPAHAFVPYYGGGGSALYSCDVSRRCVSQRALDFFARGNFVLDGVTELDVCDDGIDDAGA